MPYGFCVYKIDKILSDRICRLPGKVHGGSRVSFLQIEVNKMYKPVCPLDNCWNNSVGRLIHVVG